ncbi:cation diffusion facilitator family transporter [Clostridium bovifaecis]|uniref:Cation diffusion facilitator family transporter n=1 Tax=Clostridium bovifaecis TaxID=2184719 RepID=A0A6I6EZ39_9CLOT|nr:cation diffusion facilitator family transporter [Clostridium bovifaecis]
MENSNIKKVRNVLLIILFANMLVAVLKIVIGNLIKSTSITADGFHSLSDGTSNIIGLIGIWYASKPIDIDHPYGHRKFETLASLFIGGMLGVVGINVTIKAFERFFNPMAPSITLESVIVLIGTLIVNVFVSCLEYREGKKLNSQILISDSLHTKSDIYVSIGVLVTLVCIKFGLPPVIDSFASVIIAIFIFHAAYEILKETCSILVDKAVVDAEEIKEIVTGFSEVKDVHQIRSRGSQSELYVDLHIMIEPNMNVRESHILMHNIENKIKKDLCKNTQVIIHLEPYYSLESKKRI